MPYTVNAEGRGPAWANSLFEDNAEYGYGMKLSVNVKTNYLVEAATSLIKMECVPEEYKKVLQEWLDTHLDGEKSKASAAKVEELLDGVFCCCGGHEHADLSDEAMAEFTKIAEYHDYLVKKSVWIFGGDGWGYDIGYGGLADQIGRASCRERV